MTTSHDALKAARKRILDALADLDKRTAAAIAKNKQIHLWCVQASSPYNDHVEVKVEQSDDDRGCDYVLSTPDGRVRAHLAFVVEGTAIKVSRQVEAPWHQAGAPTFVTNLDSSVAQEVVDGLIVNFLHYVSTPPTSTSVLGGILSANDFPDDAPEE